MNSGLDLSRARSFINLFFEGIEADDCGGSELCILIILESAVTNPLHLLYTLAASLFLILGFWAPGSRDIPSSTDDISNAPTIR